MLGIAHYSLTYENAINDRLIGLLEAKAAMWWESNVVRNGWVFFGESGTLTTCDARWICRDDWTPALNIMIISALMYSGYVYLVSHSMPQFFLFLKMGCVIAIKWVNCIMLSILELMAMGSLFKCLVYATHTGSWSLLQAFVCCKWLYCIECSSCPLCVKLNAPLFSCNVQIIIAVITHMITHRPILQFCYTQLQFNNS